MGVVFIMAVVKILPFDKILGFPQPQSVLIDNVGYRLYYRWNHKTDFGHLRITKISTNKIISNKPLTKQNAFEVKDPITLELLFTLFPYEVTEDVAEVWVFV